VLLHQTIIGEEARKQLAMVDDYPDMIFAPCGGGSNFGGIAFPFFADKAAGKDVQLVAVEPSSCPTLTRGVYAYDFGDAVGHTPLMKMFTLGHDFMPPGIHAGGLRYHGDSALVSQLHKEGLVDAVAVPQLETFEAGVLFARNEGIVPAPESCHAIAATVREARKCAETGEPKTLLFNLSGHGHFDMSSYDRYFAGELEDFEYEESAIQESLKHLPKVG
jgi:tryptophan synthase beta chain